MFIMANKHSRRQRSRKQRGGGIADTAKLLKGGSCGSAAGCGVAIFGAAGQQQSIPGTNLIATNPVNMAGGSRGGEGLGAVLVPAGLFAANRVARDMVRSRRASRRYRRKSYRRRH